MNKLKVFFQYSSVLVLALLLFQSISAQNRVERILLNEANRITNDEFIYSTKTPNGAKVFSVNKTSSKMLNAIDQGLGDLFAIARKNRYYKRLNYSDYTIFIAKAIARKTATKIIHRILRFQPDNIPEVFMIREVIFMRQEWLWLIILVLL